MIAVLGAFAVVMRATSPPPPIDDDGSAAANWSEVLLYSNADTPLSGATPEGPASGGPDGSSFVKAFANVAAARCGTIHPVSPTNPCDFSRIHWGAIYTGASYDPSESGPITHLGLSVDLNALKPPPTNPPLNTQQQDHRTDLLVYFAVRQDGVVYWWGPTSLIRLNYIPPDESGWQLVDEAIDLDEVTFYWDGGATPGEPAPSGPNFVDGGPIEFGLMVGAGTNFPEHANGSDVHGYILNWPLGIDNFHVDIFRNDADTDGIDDVEDNCINVKNPSQCDTDEDGYGNGCDGDFDQNHLVTGGDYSTYFVPSLKTGTDPFGLGTDMDCNGLVTGGDFSGYFVPQFQPPSTPGPSGFPCAGTAPCP